MLEQVIALGRNVPVVQIDQHDLRLYDVFGFGLAGRHDGAGHDIKRHPRLRRPVSLNGELRRQILVGLEEWCVGRAVGRALLGKGPHRHPTLAVPEQDLGKGCDGDGVGNHRRNDVGRHHAQHRCCQAQ